LAFSRPAFIGGPRRWLERRSTFDLQTCDPIQGG
jgi:hypothetical protein